MSQVEPIVDNIRAVYDDSRTVQQVHDILAQLEAARAHRAAIRQMIDRVAQEGMYDAVPTESWQDRGGDGRYLYHYFRWDSRRERYLGPEGKKKVYVGSDPERIADARRLATNRRTHDRLVAAEQKLANWLVWRERELANLAREAGRYPTFDLQSLDVPGED